MWKLEGLSDDETYGDTLRENAGTSGRVADVRRSNLDVLEVAVR